MPIKYRAGFKAMLSGRSRDGPNRSREEGEGDQSLDEVHFDCKGVFSDEVDLESVKACFFEGVDCCDATWPTLNRLLHSLYSFSPAHIVSCQDLLIHFAQGHGYSDVC